MRAFLIISFLLTGLWSMNASAGEIYSCGAPREYNLPTETEGFCDFHQRRIAYREQALKLKEQLRERQESFAAPRLETLRLYNEELDALNEQRGSEE